ncbi:MAG: tetratricopeptide repeat protein [Steroidobacteraceae bacterium]
MSRRHARAAPRHPHAGPRRPAQGLYATELQQAWTLHARGERARAESICRSILARRAEDAGAMSLLGILLAQAGRAPEAAGVLERVAAKTPRDANAHNNYGNVLRDLGRYGKALTCYERAIEIQPDYAEAHYNRGITLHDLRRYDDALASYDRAVALEAGHACAWNNRGVTLRALGRLEEAAASHERAVSIRPGHAQAHNNRGVALQELNRLDEAIASYERALALRPHYTEAHNNLGVALQKTGRFEEAVASHDRAIAARPDYAEAYNDRGLALKELERFDEAVASFDRALTLDPDYSEAWNNRGLTLRILRRHGDALESFRRALEDRPYYVDALYINALKNRATTLFELKRFDEALASQERALALRKDPEIYAAQGAALHELRRSEEAVSCYRSARALAPAADFIPGICRHAQMQICDWNGFEADIAEMSAGIESGLQVARPFVALSLLDSPRLQRKLADQWVRQECSPRRKLPPLAPHPRHDRIRIGYFSADLRNHAVGALTAELFETHDRSRFELTAFSLGPDVRDGLRARIEPAFDRFLSVGDQSDYEIAALARRLQIDIAVDLGGYTGDARPHILALRPAPVQVSYLGYLGTMGGDFMDYLIADPVIIPPEELAHYAEKIAYLPSYQVNDSKRPIAARTFSRAELGLPPAGFVFSCFNASWKITPDAFATWMAILRAVPGSVLFLLAGEPCVKRNLRDRASAAGISANRLVFGGVLPFDEYLARYRAADLFLDTAPYNAGTTGSDALWAGLPLLTCPGRAFAARVAASLLTAVGLPELIAPDPPAYERLAIDLAIRPERLAGLRQRLATRGPGSALFDTRTFTRNLETLYERMYLRSQAGLPPDHLELQ